MLGTSTVGLGTPQLGPLRGVSGVVGSVDGGEDENERGGRDRRGRVTQEVFSPTSGVILKRPYKIGSRVILD